MKHPPKFTLSAIMSAVLFLAVVFSPTLGLAQVGTSINENIPVNSLIIPMDNINQGNATGTTFNLRAYGLVNILLQNNIPVKWAINNVKDKDGTDFTTGSFTRISGSAGSSSGSDLALSGGPFIVEGAYLSLATTLITEYNAGGSSVTVYKATTPMPNIPIRYTLTHKPFIAIGTDGGNFGTSVDQALLTRAGFANTYYQATPDNLIGSGSCFTVAMQAHSTESAFVNNYRNFVTNGGNLVLQCASINTFENAVGGHFQSLRSLAADVDLASYDVFGTNDSTDLNTTLTYPNPAMPFSQFVGILGNQDGAITEYALTGGGSPTSQFVNGTQIAAVNSGTTSNRRALVGTVSKVDNSAQPGGYAFALAGHDYDRGTDDAIGKLNGQRMLLNAIFVPVSRPCGIIGTPTVFGYKSVRLTTDQGHPGMSPLDTITWTIEYVNTGSAAAPNFQISDILPNSVTLVDTPVLVLATNSTGVAINTLYVGTTAANSNLLQSGAILGVNGRISINVKTRINAGFYGTILNQPTATATGINVAGVKTDTIDNATFGTFGGVTAPGGSVCQESGPSCTNNFQTPGIDPTGVSLFAPTSADGTISGSVQNGNGMGIAQATITVTNGLTGEVKTTLTNAFGFYSVGGLNIGNLHIVSVAAKRYTFVTPSFAFTLNDDVTGLTFVVANPANTKK